MTTLIRNDDNVVVANFVTDTSAYASGDLIADVIELPASAIGNRGVTTLKSITLVDKGDQKMKLWFVFMSAATSLGTFNAAPTISDANGATAVLAVVPVLTTEYVDLGGVSVATHECAVTMRAAAGTTSLWVGIVNDTGTPTYGAADLVGKFGFLR